MFRRALTTILGSPHENMRKVSFVATSIILGTFLGPGESKSGKLIRYSHKCRLSHGTRSREIRATYRTCPDPGE